MLVPATLNVHAIFFSEINIIKLLFPSFVFLSSQHYQRVFYWTDFSDIWFWEFYECQFRKFRFG